MFSFREASTGQECGVSKGEAVVKTVSNLAPGGAGR
jgi:hypothetical protein